MTDRPDNATRGIPGLRGAEHMGFTVPDLEQAKQILAYLDQHALLHSVGR